MSAQILVDFIVEDYDSLLDKLRTIIGNNFSVLSHNLVNSNIVVSVSMSSLDASLIRLSNKDLSDKMQVFQISSDLKNKYRNR